MDDPNDQGQAVGEGGGRLFVLPETEHVRVMTKQDGSWLGIDVTTTFPGEEGKTTIRVSLNPSQAGQLLAMLTEVNRRFSFPLPRQILASEVY